MRHCGDGRTRRVCVADRLLTIIPPGALRRQIVGVLQNGRLMSGPILEAVRGTPDATEEEIWARLEAVSMVQDVRDMPMGLHTLLTDAFRLISGGQVQRLLLARALVQKPAILVLDDHTQAAAMRAVVAMPATRIVIAHRLSTLRHADRILARRRWPSGDGRLCPT